MTNKLYILLYNLYIFIVFDFLDTKKTADCIATTGCFLSYSPLLKERG